MYVVALIILAIAMALEGAPTQPCHIDEGPPKKITKLDMTPRCLLFFSEMKLGFGSDDIKPFIELQSTCSKRPGPIPKNVLSAYKLLIIQGNPLAVLSVINFEDFPFTEDKTFIVVGSPNVPKVDISMASPLVQTVFSRVNEHQMLPNPAGNNYAFIIVKDIGKHDAKGLNTLYNPTSGKIVGRMLSTDTVKVIQAHIVDMVVLGPNDEIFQNHFSSFWPQIHAGNSKHGPMLSSNWITFQNSHLSQSWSMCDPDYSRFNANSFKVTDTSPGEPNLCNPESNPDIAMQTEVLVEDMTEAPSVVHKLNLETFSEIQQHTYHSGWTDACSKFFPQREKILESRTIQTWIHLHQEEKGCRITCYPCAQYVKLGFRPDIKRKPLITSTGYISPDIYENSMQVKNHETTPLHEGSMAFYQKLKESPSYSDSLKIVHETELAEKKLFNATMNVLLITYMEMKTGVSFNGHASFMKAMRMTGANVGWFHHTDDAAQHMTKVISKTFHKKLLEFLVENQPPFSLLADSSTSFSQPFLAVYIQTVEDGLPVTHLYGLIFLENGEKARAMADSVIKQVEIDDSIVPGFVDYFKSKLTTVVSDGASVMVGIRESFKVHMMDYAGRHVSSVVCLAHKLDNAFKNGIKFNSEDVKTIDLSKPAGQTIKSQLMYFENFEASTNNLYTFYASRGHKKWQHFVATAEELGIVPKRIKYVYKIRWSDSHFRALETIQHNYYALTEDLAKIPAEKDFDVCAKNTATQLFNKLTDKTYMLVMHEFLDILTIFKTASKLFQEASSVIIGKADVVHDVLRALHEAKTTPGSYLTKLLANSICINVCSGGSCTLQEYDDCPEVILNTVKLKMNFPTVAYYSVVRASLYDNLVSSVRRYFDLELLESFEIFNPLRFNLDYVMPGEETPANIELLYKTPENPCNVYINQDYSSRVKYLCTFYGIVDCERIKYDWTTLVSCLMETEDVKIHITQDATRFWPFAFTQCKHAWTSHARNLVEFALVTPFSSSECERGFSIMNSIKTKNRSSLDKNTLEALVRLKVNGPDVEQFDPYEYTIEFLKSSIRVDDADYKGGRRSVVENNFFKKSRIY